MSKFRIYRGREALFLKHAYQFGQHIKRVIKRGLEYALAVQHLPFACGRAADRVRHIGSIS
ncbi:hypothetical protein D3C73_1531880 [compost metagenome]